MEIDAKELTEYIHSVLQSIDKSMKEKTARMLDENSWSIYHAIYFLSAKSKI